jgi:GNAT superfamily N-acetyltransferase
MGTHEDQSRLELQLTDTVDAQSEAVIEDGLARYNKEKAGLVDARPLAVLVRDAEADEVVGGLIGRTTLGLFFVDLIFLPPTARGQGLGAQVMAMAEREASRRGCTAAVLFTITFQAPDFYARLGYVELGRVECDPPGHTRVCMTKRLTAAPADR